jgi:diguanylate cyclase (GGDEF)-like protein
MNSFQSGKVGQLVKRGNVLATMPEEATIAAAARAMSERNIGCLLVLDAKGQFCGIVTERDVVKKVASKGLDPAAVQLKDILTSEIISCTMQSAISTVEELMHWHKIRHIPVIEDGHPIAILSSRDIIAYQISRSRDMKLAAEQIARMSIELKSSDFDELAKWAVTEAARLFCAASSVLWMEPDDDQNSASGAIARSNCQCRESDIFTQVASCRENHGPSFVPLPQPWHCHGTGTSTHALVIPLKMSDCAKAGNIGVRVRCGFLCLCGLQRNGIEADEVTLYKASLLAEILSASLTNARLYREYSQARSQSLTDPLTGLGTRRLFEQEFENEHARARRYSRPFCLVVIDIDKFKLINDGLGHAAGDEALRRIAYTVQRTKRTTDVAVRYGGDEIVLLMPETDQTQGYLVAERLRRTVEEESRDGAGPAITISLGLAEWTPDRGEMPKETFKRADAALYEAKRAGRNRVCIGNIDTVAV